MVRISVANIPAELLDEYRACGKEADGRIELDRDSECYRDLFRRRAAIHAPKTAEKIAGGVGTEIAKLIKLLRINGEGCAKCSELIRLWDSWGVDECERRSGEIESTLTQRAKEKNWLLGIGAKMGVGTLVAQAIVNARASAVQSPVG